MLVCLLMTYVNRGFFVAMPGTELYDTRTLPSTEINSLLEIIVEWAGGHNHIDEDGDSPESYNTAKTAQPVIDQNPMHTIELEHPDASARKIFVSVNEAMPLSYTYGTIDHPPEKA